MNGRSISAGAGIAALVAASTYLTPFATTIAGASPTTGGTITGVVARDYDADGVIEAGDSGQAGILVTATCLSDTGPDGTPGTADDVYGAPTAPVATSVSGAYTVSVTGSPCRVEATIPAALAYLQPGAAGGSLVQFVAAGSSADFTVANPSQYCQASPDVLVTCFAYGDPAARPGSRTLSTSPYSLASATTDSTMGDTGTTYGLTVQQDLDGSGPQTAREFASSFVRRSAGLKNRKTGAIYSRPVGGGAATEFLDLDTYFGANVAGNDPHPTTFAANNVGLFQFRCTGGDGTVINYSPFPPPDCYINDPDTFDTVGKRGLGDLDISEDGRTLYTINLATRQLYAIPVGVPAVAPAPGSIGAFAIPTPCTDPGESRPFALGVRDGTVYVGGVCSGENGSGQLSGWVSSFTPGATATAGTFSGAPVFTLNFNYTRDKAGYYPPVSDCTGTWEAWRSTQAGPCGSFFTLTVSNAPAPIMTDINFDGNDLVLSVNDRYSLQMGGGLAAPTDPNFLSVYSTFAAGDLLRACRNASNTGWDLESAGACGSRTGTGGPAGFGPGGATFFNDRVGGATNYHGDASVGGAVAVPGQDLFSGLYDTNAVANQNGVARYSELNGTRTPEIGLVTGYAGDGGFGKASGIGDMEALCDQAPIEIGNRVWKDFNRNGLQDPGETPIAGVVVELYQGSVKVGETTTDADGVYLFGGTALHGGAALAPNTAYVIRIANASGSSIQSPLSGLTLTGADQGGDTFDTDGIANGTSAEIAVLTGASGHNNHTYDFGFAPPPPTTTTTTTTTTSAVTSSTSAGGSTTSAGKASSSSEQGNSATKTPSGDLPVTGIALASFLALGGGALIGGGLILQTRTRARRAAYHQANH